MTYVQNKIPCQRVMFFRQEQQRTVTITIKVLTFLNAHHHKVKAYNVYISKEIKMVCRVTRY